MNRNRYCFSIKVKRRRDYPCLLCVVELRDLNEFVIKRTVLSSFSSYLLLYLQTLILSFDRVHCGFKVIKRLRRYSKCYLSVFILTTCAR